MAVATLLGLAHRDDYKKAGFKMLPGVNGEHITCEVVLTTMLLVPLSITATMVGLTGVFYAAVAVCMGIAWTLLAFRFFKLWIATTPAASSLPACCTCCRCCWE